MSSLVSCIIVDDDRVFQTVLKTYVNKCGLLELKAIFDNASEAINYLSDHNVELIFLDIELPEISGLELLKTLRIKPKVILVSGEEKYAVEAFEFQVSDYLVKPLKDYGRFLKAVLHVKSELYTSGSPARTEVFVKEGTKFVRIDLCDILYIEGFGDYLKIYTSSKTVITHSSIKSFMLKLPAEEFLQVHRSFIVRSDKIDNIEANMIRIGQKSLPISKSHREKVINELKML